ncbi:alkaline phosphatase D family protein [Flavimarina sp. Hel_I_48]|uniref:alkaline phosphatase D family protein n=1 Tax=Flavimarina sp. Hel_I_48 TaxID=1392488 RepID=UPI0004DF7DD2|nr:alkaline phosphatase D family protein [Flavimarina sp. Hel_I_48]
MKINNKIFFLICLVMGGIYAQKPDNSVDNKAFVIAFGSCNKVEEPNPFWEQVTTLEPDLFIWGGDNIYADTGNMKKMEKMYNAQNANPEYAKVKAQIPIMATWDDHDYGKNDAGKEWRKKEKSQQLFLDFLDVDKNDPRRNQDGIYYAENFSKGEKEIKVIVLDTRYFRSAPLPSPHPNKRYTPAVDSSVTLLGARQWEWLEDQLVNNTADFTFVMSSIQLLSGEHGFETWGNFPIEVDRFLNLLEKSKAKNVIILSGDRHISEFSKKVSPQLGYPLIDFTSSGLTHAYTQFDGEPNKYRVGNVIAERSFGVIKVDLATNNVIFEIIGADGDQLQKIEQNY